MIKKERNHTSNFYQYSLVNVCVYGRERQREDTSARDLGQGDFTFCQKKRKKERKGGGASVKETWPV